MTSLPLSPQRRTLAVLVLAFAGIAAACSPSPGAAAPTLVPARPSPAAGVPAALPSEVPVADALALRDAGAFVLDVRQPDEWSTSHIPGATLIPLGELASRVAEVPADRQVVVVCRSGNRSAQGRNILRGAGLASVTSMAGGMNDWVAAGYPVETGG